MSILTNDFESFLTDYFAENEGALVLDDNLPDAFEYWLTRLDVDEIIRLANLYGKTLVDNQE